MKKEKIFFIPTYIGPLRHYERLIPYLQDKYDVAFVFVRPDGDRGQEVSEYCQKKGYEFFVVNEGLNRDKGMRWPFFTAIKKRYRHSRACYDFLQKQRPAKIISHKTDSPYDTFFKEANRLGIETIILQWSSAASMLEYKVRNYSWPKKVYLFLLKICFSVLDLFYEEPRFGSKPAIPKKIGVFTKEKRQYYIDIGYDPATISIVGSLDFQLAHELRNKIINDQQFKNDLLDKYSIFDKGKLNILVVLYRFYLAPDDKYKMTIEENVQHYLDLFATIRKVFSESEANILLKLHPTENSEPDMYKVYEQFGVKFYWGQARTEELLCLSDLYVAEPTTSVNYMALGGSVPAIFVNFSDYEFLNERASRFNIRHVVKSKEEFGEQLQKFKLGNLEKQFDDSDVEFKSIEKTVEFIN